jgi:hypothetical protein
LAHDSAVFSGLCVNLLRLLLLQACGDGVVLVLLSRKQRQYRCRLERIQRVLPVLVSPVAHGDDVALAVVILPLQPRVLPRFALVRALPELRL